MTSDPSSRWYFDFLRRQGQNICGFEAPVFDVLADVTPQLAVMRLGADAVSHDVTLLFLGAVEQLEAIEARPGVALVGIELDGAREPLASLRQLTLSPEQPGDKNSVKTQCSCDWTVD